MEGLIHDDSAGATVHMVCRNQSRGEEARQEIMSESGNDVRANMYCLYCCCNDSIALSFSCRKSSSIFWIFQSQRMLLNFPNSTSNLEVLWTYL